MKTGIAKIKSPLLINYPKKEGGTIRIMFQNIAAIEPTSETECIIHTSGGSFAIALPEEAVFNAKDIAKNNNGGVFMEKKLTAKDKVDWFFSILFIASFFFCFVFGFSNNPDFKSFLLVSFFTMAVSGVYLVVFYFVARRDHRRRIDKLNTARKGCGRELLPY